MSDVYGHAEAIGQVQTEEAKTFIFNNALIACVAGDRKDTKDLGFGGFTLNADKAVVVLASQFDNLTPPVVNDTFEFDDGDVFVSEINKSPDGTFFVYGCSLIKGI